MRKGFAAFLIAALLLSASVGMVTAKESEDNFEKFQQLGFSDEEISNLTSEEIKMFEDVKDPKLISSEESYYHVTVNKQGKEKFEKVDKKTALKESKEKNEKKKQYKDKLIELNKSKEGKSLEETKQIDEQITALATEWNNEAETDGWMRLSGYVTYLGSNQYNFKTSYDWMTDPLVRIRDVVGISHSSDWQVMEDYEYAKHIFSRYYSGYKDQYGGCYCTDFIDRNSKYNYSPEVGINGVASEFRVENDMPSSPYYDYVNFRGYIVERVKKGNSGMTNSNMFGTYAHQEIETGSISVDIFPTNVSVSPAFAFEKADTVNVAFPVQ